MEPWAHGDSVDGVGFIYLFFQEGTLRQPRSGSARSLDSQFSKITADFGALEFEHDKQNRRGRTMLTGVTSSPPPEVGC